jgi:rfaE bifunctional protein nucleotidyltransferase chain/domain
MKVVFTNGCFDILHAGHVRYLAHARSLGDKLIVGLNSDESVARLGKGPGRPIVGQDERREVLLALRCVDEVVIFGEDTPLRLIGEVRPDVLVKGGDWPVEKIAGHELVLGYGGKVLSLPFAEGNSTTSIVQKIVASHSL